MNNNTIFHVHTYRCKHASREDDAEYVKKAIELGATEIVFTDHAPFLNNPFQMRMSMDELEDYITSLRQLKDIYINDIDVKIGLEIEYIPTHLDYYQYLKKDCGIDLLLLGQHFALLPDGRYTFELMEKSKEAIYLADAMLEAMKTGFFEVVAHPDQIFRRQAEWTEEMEIISQKIKECAVQTGTVLEQNISNMYEKKRKHLYRQEFWRDTPSGLKTIYGVDAHSVEELEMNFKRQQFLS